MDYPFVILFFLAAYLIGKTALSTLALVLLVFGAAFSAASLCSAWMVLRRPAPLGGALAPVTILKPLKGCDRGLYENLASFCDQDYPRFQILLSVASPDDPALPVAERLKKNFPERDIRIVISDECIGHNPKISNVSNAYPLAEHDLLLMSDSDIRVPPDFLRRSVAAFTDPRVGLVTAFYRSAGAAGVWSILESFSVNFNFLPQTLLAKAFGMRFAMGAAILVRRQLFDRIGGFAALADHLADDFALGEAVEAAGSRIAFSDVVVESIPPEASGLFEMFRHQVRWQRTVRLCHPAGYCGSLLLHGFSLASLALLFFGWNPRLAAGAVLLLALKAAAGLAIQRLSGAMPRLLPVTWLPLSEWLGFAAWLSGFGPSAVLWRGQRYRVLPDGRLVPPSAARGLP